MWKTESYDQVDGDGEHFDQADEVEISMMNSLQSEYNPGTVHAEVDVPDSWESLNIKQKECVTFIPGPSNGGVTCCCGQSRELHYPENSVPDGPSETTWDPEIHVKEFPSEFHGDMIFVGPKRTVAKYVRASCDTKPDVLYELITQHWGLRVPRLLISVTGGAKNFSINPRLKKQFIRGLVKAAKSTKAWIITGGSHAGVMKHVGEAVQEISGGQQEIVLIGIAPWGTIHNRKSLLRNKEGPALYPVDEESQGNLCCLDSNHSHFILVDNGTHGQYAVEIPLRTQLEKFISQKKIQETESAIKIPIVCVVLEGGPGTLETIYNSMRNNTPCVIVKGSGRISNVIADVADLGPSKITTSLIKEKLQTYFQELFDETKIIMWTKQIQAIVQMDYLLTILGEERVGEQGMDVAILQALLKASRHTDQEKNGDHQKNRDHQLQLAVSWNRIDIAETQIFTKDWPSKPSDLYPSLMLSLIDDRPAFVNLFLDHGVSLAEFLTLEKLMELYKNTKQSTLIHSKLERQRSKRTGRSKTEKSHIDCVLNNFLGKPLRQKAKTEHIMMNENCLEYPLRDLLFWCILQHRVELSQIVWSLTQDCVAGALFCTKVLKALARKEDDSEIMEEMKALADVYEEHAVGVFSKCHSNNEKQAEILLKHESPKWGKTILELAQESQTLTFMSHGGVQMFLTKSWWGKLSVYNGFVKIFLCMLLFPLIYSGLITYRHKPFSCHLKFKAFFRAPVIKFYYNTGSYIGFLWLFAYVLMMDFQTYPSWREYLLYVWIFSLLCEELRQSGILLSFCDRNRHPFNRQPAQYIKDFWNQVDISALFLFVVGLICRLVCTDTVYLGRVFLSLDFMILCIRLMHIFTISKVLGPKIIIIHRMVKDMFFFLFLLAIFIVSYGVAKQAILTTNETRLSWIFRNVVYYPYLTLFGHLPSDMDSLNFNPTECSQNGINSTLPKCVYNDGSGNALFPEWLIIILMCLYLLLANILLLNLLIAMFSYTFEDIQSQSDQVWKFYRIDLIKEYNECPVVPPPFILLAHLYLALKYTFGEPLTRDKLLRCKFKEDDKSSLLYWESYMKDNYWEMRQQQKQQSHEYVVKEIAESVSALLKKEKMGESYQLDGRLSVLEKQMAQSTQCLNWIMSALQEKGFSSKTQISGCNIEKDEVLDVAV
ncbi:transient receptor potential cation channel subfamily M member 2-like [Pseudophryne corroboree]|uniref:transient receptor potential cation channel subfamily M member 2-like n=1 Tax=Pseudophryne corroboree TaxID=495146 RepID=UPI0030819751